MYRAFDYRAVLSEGIRLSLWRSFPRSSFRPMCTGWSTRRLHLNNSVGFHLTQKGTRQTSLCEPFNAPDRLIYQSHSSLQFRDLRENQPGQAQEGQHWDKEDKGWFQIHSEPFYLNDPLQFNDNSFQKKRLKAVLSGLKTVWWVFDETNLSCYSKYKLWDNCFYLCAYKMFNLLPFKYHIMLFH